MLELFSNPKGRHRGFFLLDAFAPPVSEQATYAEGGFGQGQNEIAVDAKGGSQVLEWLLVAAALGFLLFVRF